HIHPDDMGWAVESRIQSASNKLPHEFEYRMIAADGNIVWLRDFVTVLPDDHQQPYRLHGVMVDITEHKKSEQQLEESYRSIRDLTEHLQNAKEEERKTIAREIHDDLGQQLAVLRMDIDWISKMVHPEDKATKHKLENLLGLTDNMVKAVRKIYSGLRPSLLDDMGL